MPIFGYKASKPNGEVVTGKMDAQNYEQVYQKLSEQQLLTLDIQQDVDFDLKKFSDKLKEFEIGGIPLNEKVIFSRQLATMLAAGLPVTQTIEILIQQTKYARMRTKLGSVYKDVQSGLPLSLAFSKADLIFNELQISLIEAGENSGNLVEIMNQIADDMRNSSQLQGRIKGAMIYPIVIFLVIIAVVAIIMIFMIPAVQGLYKDFGDVELPWVTQVLVMISNAMTNPVVLTISIVLLIAGFISFRAFYKTKGGKSSIDKLLLVMPIFGDVISKVQVYEMSRLLHMLLKSGIPIIDALKSTSKALGNYHYRTALENAAVEVSKGVPLAVPLSRSRVIPIIVVKLIATGEQTGKTDQILAEITRFYGDQVEEITSNLTKLMEPIIMVMAGGMVAFLAMAIYLPIYNLGNVIK
jgi:type IV pilus assembly protein PilC